MKTIVISGIIGFWDNDAEWLRREIAGENDIRVEIASPGGFVYDGIEMFNILKNHPGKVHTHLMGLAASMASYLALAGDTITAEGNAVYMIHNASMYVGGDYRDFKKAADYLNGINSILAKKYAERTGKSISEIRKFMDEETFFFSDEILKAGFVDSITEVETKEDRSESLSYARLEIEDCLAKMEKFEKKNEKMAALFTLDVKNEKVNDYIKKNLDKTNENNDSNLESSENKNLLNAGQTINRGKFMDTEELAKKLIVENPALYDYILNQGRGKERKRVNAHLALGEKTKAYKFMNECIANGASIMDEDVTAKYMVAGMNQGDLKNRTEDNPPDTNNTQDLSDSAEDAIWKEVNSSLGIDKEVN